MNISTMLIFINSLIEFVFPSLFLSELSPINLLNIGKIPFSHKTSLKVTLLCTTFFEQEINSDKNKIASFLTSIFSDSIWENKTLR